MPSKEMLTYPQEEAAVADMTADDLADRLYRAIEQIRELDAAAGPDPTFDPHRVVLNKALRVLEDWLKAVRAVEDRLKARG